MKCPNCNEALLITERNRIETGLFFGFFLPGDSLLFIAGMVVANALMPFNTSFLSLLYWIFFIATAGIAGKFAGYWFGKKSERFLFQRRDSWLFKKKYLLQAKEFYDKKGGGAIVLDCFLPIIRTVAPIVAGMVKMDMRKFVLYNGAGSFLWAGSIVSTGFLSGENKWVQSNLEKIIIGIVIITTAPVLLRLLTAKKIKANVASNI
jgi:membrane-associated protein